MVGEHGEKGHPWTNLIPVLLGHHPGDLGEVPQVVHDPGRQELAQRDTTQARVFPREIELSRGQLPGPEQIEVRGTQLSEFGEQGCEGAAYVARPVAESIVRLEAKVGSFRKHDAGARNPVGLFTVNQMPDHIEGAEGVGTLRASGPRLPQTVEERAERRGRASQHLHRRLEIEMHGRQVGCVPALTMTATAAEQSARLGPGSAQAALRTTRGKPMVAAKRRRSMGPPFVSCGIPW